MVATVVIVAVFVQQLMVDDDGITRVDIDKQKKRDEPIKVNAILAFVVDNHDGTYKCTYAPLLAGFYSIEVRCNGDEIEGSPYSMWAKAGAPVASRSKMRNANGLEIEQNQTIKVRAGEEFYVDVDISDKFRSGKEAALLACVLFGRDQLIVPNGTISKPI